MQGVALLGGTITHIQRGVTSRWGIPPDPNLSFSSARRKELKEASTPSKASPYMGRMQHEKSQKPTTFLRFGIAGHAIYFLSAGAYYCRTRQLEGRLVYIPLSPFSRGGESRDVKDHGSPRRGKGSASHTKTLT